MKNWKRHAREWLTSLLIAFAIFFTVNTYVAQAMKVKTGSMIPTLEISDRIFVEKLVSLTEFHFQDIIVFHPPVPGHEKEAWVKRVIGLPGDTIEIRDRKLYRNGEAVDEPYIREEMRYSMAPVVVPEDHYFVLGDNRNDSLDSHLWDQPFVHKDRVIGKAMATFYPFSRANIWWP
ncbi:signal peptidase I [Paenibacillus thermoaerophilus]|uniref:Signal peptidase I n=1 Tax=Paenibacillus thermoaerophilus TaxID=1215385 RepID=A0ABW2V4Z0_9BACL|nr:signal peptidase I [Paenibacillus thermoaerophilus]TMV18411.1 signal peptidase I [Paenibacillus thermoaerophilus]